jgi:hypothetical protein
VSIETNNPNTLRCPFCSSVGVEINDVKVLRLTDQTICEYLARCPNCKKAYRQASPANLLPLEFRSAL